MATNKERSAISGALSGATTGASIGGVPGAAIGGLIGGAAGFFGAEEDESSKYYDALRARLDAIQVPGIEQLTFTPEELQYLGDFTPEELQTYVLEKSKMEGVQVDPRLRQEQMKALDRVSQLADKGFSDEDMMALNIARQQAAGEAEAKQQQILQNMAQRGQGGSGAELIARLTSSQNAANQLSLEQQKQAIAQAEARKQALNMLASQSGALRSQEFGEQSEIAKAQDVVNRINMQNAQDVARANVAARNQAGATNLARREATQAANVGQRNLAKERKTQAYKDIYGMEMGKATGQMPIAIEQARSSRQRSADTAAGIGQIGQGAIQLAGSGVFKSGTTPKQPQTDEEVLDQDVSWMD